MELQDYRRQYTKGGLREASMPDDPWCCLSNGKRGQCGRVGRPYGGGGSNGSTGRLDPSAICSLKGVGEDGLFSLPITTATRQRH